MVVERRVRRIVGNGRTDNGDSLRPMACDVGVNADAASTAAAAAVGTGDDVGIVADAFDTTTAAYSESVTAEGPLLFAEECMALRCLAIDPIVWKFASWRRPVLKIRPPE